MRKTLISLAALGAGLTAATVGLAQTPAPAADSAAAAGAAPAAAAMPATAPASTAPSQGAGSGAATGAGFGDGRGPGGPGGFDGRGGPGNGPGGPGGSDGRGGGPGGPGGFDGRGPGGPGGGDGRGPGGGPGPNLVIPTSGDGRMLLDLVGKYCDPIMADPKVNLDRVMRGSNFERIRPNKTDLPYGGFKGPFSTGAPYSVTFVGQSEANQKVCEFVLDAPKDDAQILADAITPWSNLHKPFMALRRNDLVAAGAGNLRRFTWLGLDETQSYALNMNLETNPDGSSPFSGGDRIRVRYSINKR